MWSCFTPSLARVLTRARAYTGKATEARSISSHGFRHRRRYVRRWASTPWCCPQPSFVQCQLVGILQLWFPVFRFPCVLFRYILKVTMFIMGYIAAAYPTFGAGFFSNEPSVDPFAVDPSPSPPIHQIGLLQPKSSFIHHRYGMCLLNCNSVVMAFATVSSGDCTQIPKLRVACASGVNGQRSMWTHCEQCGAISIVESD